MASLKQKLENLNSGTKFLILILFIYSVVLFFNPSSFILILDKFITLLIQVLPAFLVMFLLIFIFNLFLNNQQIKKYLTIQNNWKKQLLVVGLGILSSGPIYIWFPFLADLKKHGVKNDLITIFLYNRAIKLPLIPVMLYYFSWSYILLITVLTIIFSVINDFIVGKLVKK